uniref:Thiamine triphosphatase n=1 Tax=Cyprinus carpio TaxID=7962 RepID=A0A8C2IP85_CYPCA
RFDFCFIEQKDCRGCDGEIMEKQDIGGVSHYQNESFIADFILTLKDFWLRYPLYTIQRDNQFPSDSIRTIRERTAEGSESNSSQREQIDKVAENEDTEICSADDTKWLNDLNLVCFAEFETERCSYTLEREAGAVRVGLEQADFGYCVGEIEALVSEGGGMNAALQKFICCHFILLRPAKGKMDVYLQRYRPEHYAELLSAHIL